MPHGLPGDRIRRSGPAAAPQIRGDLEEVTDTVSRIQAAGLRAKGLFMMGLPGETEASIRRTSDFVMSLGLDDMNMTKFTPFPGAPIWDDHPGRGGFDRGLAAHELSQFRLCPQGDRSRERLDEFYNRHVKRFYTDPPWRRKFRSRLWEHRWSLWHLLKHIPAFLSARSQFEPAKVPD